MPARYITRIAHLISVTEITREVLGFDLGEIGSKFVLTV